VDRNRGDAGMAKKIKKIKLMGSIGGERTPKENRLNPVVGEQGGRKGGKKRKSQTREKIIRPDQFSEDNRPFARHETQTKKRCRNLDSSAEKNVLVFPNSHGALLDRSASEGQEEDTGRR